MANPIIYKASELGACTKYLICKRLGFESTPNPNASPIPAFERGKKMEGEVIEWMREQGWKIEQEQAEYLIPLYSDIVLECHPDVVAHLPGWQGYWGLGLSTKNLLPLAVEIKTCDLRAFEDFKENGILAKGLFPRYRWQVSAYALATGLTVAMIVREHETGGNRTWVELLPSSDLYSRDQIIARIESIEEAASSYSIPVECDLPNIYCPIPFMHESVVVDDPVLDQYARDYLSELKGLRKKAREQIIAHTNAQDVSRKVDTGRYSVSVAHAKTGVVMVRVTDRLDKKNREKKRDAKGRQ